MRKVKVDGFFRELSLDKEAFIKRWSDWANDYYNLVHWAEAKEFVDKVKQTAAENFEREAVEVDETKDGAKQLELQF